MKDSFYFPHDYNAQRDPKTAKLIRVLGWEAYGLYWGIVERLYENGGRISEDYEFLSYELRFDQEKIKSIINNFDLFHVQDGMIGSDSVDRRINERRERSEIARQNGIASGKSRQKRTKPEQPLNNCSGFVEQPLNNCSGFVELEIKEIKERKEITTAPSAVDFSEVRFPYGNDKGRIIADMAEDECKFYLQDGRLGSKIRAALKDRIEAKESERV